MKTVIFLGALCLTLMLAFKLSGRLSNQNLVSENGEVSATLLPLDLESFDKDHETATFGIG